MSREQYTPPTLSQPSQQQPQQGSSSTNNPTTTTNAGAGAPSSSSYAGFNITGAGNFEDASRPVHYLCGDCDSKVVLRKSDPIRCKECGYRVLYKERTNR
ncbi:hypothetical protein B0A55_10223 [Friedmanniomyces simplex]|uniref:DNA-directed RNA polymerases I, II, and III subunit RPABC4 n=1 Tax=Friedmanniomyces simplex TaxID=329884 RepID=A0A4V5NDH6_9PEZI|nr:hypothetical protein B0A55_10223 [Friedmanniomyces simplex]